ncbi:hypothetical protein QP794_01445 [Paenibacillus sp. UMB7766-LJ446]|uniref:hypothetical protein n=1 Tax=Paenibacillus sp. UMB7766-LJ446 TaxID=3046313 RepID=UPI00254DA10C|nr:hypothetical protein [Paenibacillus sp. UMB7766-LJ446]MDK8188745.1 hypothetical protein [Paenibacillus sp. UMB7766-LJ446]
MKKLRVEFPWDIEMRSAELYIMAIILEYRLDAPLIFTVVMPSHTYSIEVG